jgi:hypothetical protein
MLAGTEEAVQPRKWLPVSGGNAAIEALLAGLIDYAGLYPPASLDMGSAVRNYLRYRRGSHAGALGRFVVSLDRIGELRRVAEDSLAEIRLSVIFPANAEFSILSQLLNESPGRIAFECKVSRPSDIERVTAQLQANAGCYFEIPMGQGIEQFLDAIAVCGARVKIRMGGVIAAAFPAAKTIAHLLGALAERHIPFKATAGLHHPIRSRHPFTYEASSSAGMMHGFVNLASAAAVVHFGGTTGEALQALEEEDGRAWQIEPEAIRFRGLHWSADQVREVRQRFFTSFGSCSFEEPMRDLEAMGWL